MTNDKRSIFVFFAVCVALIACFIALPRLLHIRVRSLVIVYAAQDQVYAEPILREFENSTGIKVKAVYDSEAVKTVGLANRLLAERSHPQCDVFWGNEEMRARQLAAQGVFRETNGWAAFGHRSRRIVINTNLVSMERRSPTRLDQKVVLYPMQYRNILKNHHKFEKQKTQHPRLKCYLNNLHNYQK